MFDFYFPDIIYQNPSSWWLSLIATLIGTLVGASLGFVGAMRLQKNQDKNLAYQKLSLFSSLTNDVLTVMRKQIDEYVSLSVNITEEPYEYHLPHKLASSDLERIHYLLKGEIFSPLVFVLGSVANDYYKNIRKTIDFIYLANNELYNMNQKHIDFTYGDQCFVRDSVDDITNVIIKRTEVLKRTDVHFEKNTEFLYLLELDSALIKLRKDSEEKKNSNLEGYKTEFLEEILKNGLSKIEQTSSFEIINMAKPALNRLEKIRINSLGFVVDCKSYCDQIDGQLPLLESYNKTLIENLKLHKEKRKEK